MIPFFHAFVVRLQQCGTIDTHGINSTTKYVSHRHDHLRETAVSTTPHLSSPLVSTTSVCIFTDVHQRQLTHSFFLSLLAQWIRRRATAQKHRSARETDVPPDLRRHVLSFLVASPNTPDRNGNTALLAACENRGTPAVLELLASHGADATCTNHLGETALHVACRRGNAELAQYILDRESSARAAACSDAAPEASSVGATDARGRRPGEVRDIDVGVHEALAVRQVVGTECGRSM